MVLGIVVFIVESPSTVDIFLLVVSAVFVRFRIPVLTTIGRVGIKLTKGFTKLLRLRLEDGKGIGQKLVAYRSFFAFRIIEAKIEKENCRSRTE